MLRFVVLILSGTALASCGSEEIDYGPEVLEREGAAIDSQVAEASQKAGMQHGGVSPRKEPEYIGAYRKISVPELSLAELGDEGREDLFDAMLFPEEYSDEERQFPEHIQALDGQLVALRGYMRPSESEGHDILKLEVLGDLLSCCFGGAASADQWVSVTMAEGKSSEYFAFVPVLIKGRFEIEVIEDEAGYPAGCYSMEAVSVEREK